MEYQHKIEDDLEKDDELLLQDRTHLLQFLPPEIWKHVTTKLPKVSIQNSNENLSNSSPFYRKLLDGEKTKFLFGKVVNILAENKHLQLNHVLNCRQVCKHWNKNIDKMLCTEYSKLCLNRETYQFSSYTKVTTFITHFENSHLTTSTNLRSPFIGDQVMLTVNHEFLGQNIIEIDQLKLSVISRFVEGYGSHIKKISITLNLNSHRVFQHVVVRRLKRWMLLMPNLTAFSVTNKMMYLEEVYPESGPPKIRKPYPTLKKLKEFHINAWFPENVGINIIKNNNHISKLHVEKNWSSRINHQYIISGLPALESLTYLDISVGSLGKLENLANLNLPHLSTLTLIAERGLNFNKQLRWSDILSVIATKFGSRLERLSLEIGSSDKQVLEDTKTFQLNLPKLKEIRLFVREQQFSLDFLLPIKDTVERICVMGNQVHVEGDGIHILNLQKLRTTRAIKLEVIHFDKSFEDIRNLVNEERILNGVKRTMISDRILLR